MLLALFVAAPPAGRAGIAATGFEPEFARYEARDDALSPWLTPHLVTVRRIETADYPADGEDGILDPPPGWREAMGDAGG
jgi:hypothetical protein